MSFLTYLQLPPSQPQSFFICPSMSGTCPIIHLTHGLQKQPHKSRKELIALNQSEKKQVPLSSEELLCYRNHHKINRVVQIAMKSQRCHKIKRHKTAQFCKKTNMTIFVQIYTNLISVRARMSKYNYLKMLFYLV